MQAKMASRSRLLNGAYRRLLQVLMPLFEILAAMERCLASGRGCVFLTAHLGNWEMGGLLLGDRAREVAVVYVPDRFERVEEYRSRYRRRAGLTEIPVASDAFSALPALRI